VKLACNATRMELLRLKRRLILARRGHKLLKDKQDELVRQFLVLIDSIRGLRSSVETKLSETYDLFLQGRMDMSREAVEEALMIPGCKVDLDTTQKTILNLHVPVLRGGVGNPERSYGFSGTSGNLDQATIRFQQMVPKLLELAQSEKTLMLIGDEIERTRRRVNALEYVLIPNLEETRKYIEVKLGEMERSNLTRLMKVKEMIRKE
jgi:V/A-type H+-transporting ATPase subunit D